MGQFGFLKSLTAYFPWKLWYAGPRYLEKYGMKKGKTYPCILGIIKEGNCTPVIFEFETIDTRDYFETQLKVKKQKALPKFP